ncbi:hypothetical protein GCM10023185_13290 [Hymenobacter saemangeumensis]|uniref:Uncharacterized protein n=1 Tax=Hymenobacter saemangeumensis TaxID=1084522 RepID=A0ABP8I7L1_9BACT
MPKARAVDLADVLAQGTEAVNTGTASDFAPDVQPTPEASSSPDDFGPEPEEVDAQEVFTAGDDDETETAAPTPEDALKSARRIISFVDNLQKPFLVSAYKRSVLWPGDEEKLTEFNRQRAARGKYSLQDAITEDSDFYQVSKRAEEFFALCEAAPFTDDEKDSLAGPLSEVLEKYTSLQLTPEMALLAAVAMVMLPRVAPLIPAFRKGFTL